MCNYDFLINVKNAGVIHFPENTSDHSPIYCETSETYSDIKIDCDEKITNPPVNLKSMTDEDWSNFNTILDTKLEGMIIPDCVSCRDIHYYYYYRNTKFPGLRWPLRIDHVAFYSSA